MSVESYIKENVKVLKNKIMIAPDIPDKKMDNAISAIAPGVDPDYVVAIVDTTLFGNSKEGLLFTGDTIYLRAFLSDAKSFAWQDILSAEYKVTQVAKNDKTEDVEDVILHLRDNSDVKITSDLTSIPKKEFADFINGAVGSAESENDYVSTSQVCPLSDMSPEIKLAYIKVICNLALSDDNMIDPQEYAEIISLIVRISMDKASRLQMRTYMAVAEEQEDTASLLAFLRQEVDPSNCSIVMLSLMKDALYVHRKLHQEEKWADNAFLCDLQKSCGLSEEQVTSLLAAIDNDEDILRKRKNDTEIQRAFKDTAAKLAAVGVPVIAVYFSGSVIGLSAAGLTSGLAALGMGGILGFSSMFTGIGVAVLLGVGTYQGVKKVTGLKDLENNKQRERMLQEIISNSQKSLNYLIEDVNEIALSLQQAIEKSNRDDIKLQKLSATLAMLTRSAQAASERLQYASKEEIITHLPLILRQMDYDRILELTDSATRQKLRAVIFEVYTEEQEEKEDGDVATVYCLNDLSAMSELSAAYDALKAIGYYKVADSAIATAKSTVKNLIGDLV